MNSTNLIGIVSKRVFRVTAHIVLAAIFLLGLGTSAAGAAPEKLAKPDLTILFGRTTTVFQDSVTVNFTVRNQGTAHAHAFRITIYDENLNPLASRYRFFGLGADRQHDESIQIAHINNARKLLIRADSSNNNAEWDESNNAVWVTVKYPLY